MTVYSWKIRNSLTLPSLRLSNGSPVLERDWELNPLFWGGGNTSEPHVGMLSSGCWAVLMNVVASMHRECILCWWFVGAGKELAYIDSHGCINHAAWSDSGEESHLCLQWDLQLKMQVSWLWRYSRFSKDSLYRGGERGRDAVEVAFFNSVYILMHLQFYASAAYGCPFTSQCGWKSLYRLTCWYKIYFLWNVRRIVRAQALIF